MVAAFVLSLAAACSVQGAEPSIKVELVIPSQDGAGRVSLDNARAHFHVLLSNVSPRQQRVWRDSSSWGYYALSFELTDEGGTRHEVRKRRTGFTRNVPASWLLAPGGHLVFDVALGDKMVWEGVPKLGQGCRPFQLRASFDVTPDSTSAEQTVWTGHTASSTESVSLCE